MNIFGLQKTTLVDYPGRVAATLFTGGCNFRCPYCQNKDLVLTPNDIEPYTHDEIFDFLNKRVGILEGVVITGGEPTLHYDLPDFIRDIKSLGYLVKLDTNGSNPDMLINLCNHKLIDYVAMDIKQCPDKYNEIACMSNFDFEKISASVDFLLSDKIDYEFRTTVPAELFTENDIRDIGKWIAGAHKYFLQPYRESEGVINPIFTAPKDGVLDTYIRILQESIETVETRG